DVFVGFQCYWASAVVDADRGISTVCDGGIGICWAGLLARISVGAVFEAAIEAASAHEFEIDLADANVKLIHMRPSVRAIDVVGARGDRVDFCEDGKSAEGRECDYQCDQCQSRAFHDRSPLLNDLLAICM